MGEAEDDAAPTANVDSEMHNILILPSAHVPLQDNANDQLKHFCHVVSCKMDEYNEFLKQNSAVVFAVNYIQNRFVAAELCTEVGKLFEILNVKTEAEFNKAIEALQSEADTAATVENFETVVKNWDAFIEGIEKDLDAKVGPITSSADDDALPELGVGSKAISHYVKGSAYEMVLVVVVRCFNSPTITQHIMDLYNKMTEFRKLGCDVYLLTRGPPIGTRGGAYIKLIGVPFRKLYDEEEALAELKAHRHSAMELVGWRALLRAVETSLAEEIRPQTGYKRSGEGQNEDQTGFIAQKGGTILVDKSGNVLYKFVEDENATWPTVDDLISQVKKVEPASKSKASMSNTAKIDSEVSAKDVEEKKKPCCVIV